MSARTRRRLKNLEEPTSEKIIVETPEPITIPEWVELRKKFGRFAVENLGKLENEGLTTKQALEILAKLDQNKSLNLKEAHKIAKEYTKKGEPKL